MHLFRFCNIVKHSMPSQLKGSCMIRKSILWQPSATKTLYKLKDLDLQRRYNWSPRVYYVFAWLYVTTQVIEL